MSEVNKISENKNNNVSCINKNTSINNIDYLNKYDSKSDSIFCNKNNSIKYPELAENNKKQIYYNNSFNFDFFQTNPVEKRVIFIDSDPTHDKNQGINPKKFVDGVLPDANKTTILTEPTKEETLNTLKNAVSETDENDKLYVFYQGHGTQLKIGTEGKNNPNEGLYFYHSKERISDNEIAETFSDLPKGSDLIFFINSCK